MYIVHEIMKGMGELVQKQSEDIELIVDDIDVVEENTE